MAFVSSALTKVIVFACLPYEQVRRERIIRRVVVTSMYLSLYPTLSMLPEAR